MSKAPKKKIYEALVEGATTGLSDVGLFEYVRNKCPKVTGKKIVRASLLALSDPELKDPQILKVIYALAIKHRMDSFEPNDEHGDD